MIVNVTVVYEAWVLRNRKRNPEAGMFTAALAVEVPEVAGVEAPVAFTHSEADSDCPPEARWYGGRLWVPHDGGTGDCGRQASAAEFLAELSDPDHASLGPHPRGPRSDGVSASVADADPTVRVVYRSDLDEVLEAARRELADRLVVDGMAWRALAEPVIRIGHTGDHVWAGIQVRSKRDHLCFRLDEADRVPDCLPGLEPGAVRAAVSGLGISVRLPEALGVDTRTPALAEAARLALDVMRGRIEVADGEHFASFAAVRDAHHPVDVALAAHAAREDRQGGPLFAEGDVAALADALRAAVGRHGPGTPWKYPEWLVERIEGALARPDPRPAPAIDMELFRP